MRALEFPRAASSIFNRLSLYKRERQNSLKKQFQRGLQKENSRHDWSSSLMRYTIPALAASPRSVGHRHEDRLPPAADLIRSKGGRRLRSARRVARSNGHSTLKAGKGLSMPHKVTTTISTSVSVRDRWWMRLKLNWFWWRITCYSGRIVSEWSFWGRRRRRSSCYVTIISRVSRRRRRNRDVR